MSRNWLKIWLGALALFGTAAGANAATTLTGTLPTNFYTTYGDANVYSLPTLQYITQQANCSTYLASCGMKADKD